MTRGRQFVSKQAVSIEQFYWNSLSVNYRYWKSSYNKQKRVLEWPMFETGNCKFTGIILLYKMYLWLAQMAQPMKDFKTKRKYQLKHELIECKCKNIITPSAKACVNRMESVRISTPHQLRWPRSKTVEAINRLNKLDGIVWINNIGGGARGETQTRLSVQLTLCSNLGRLEHIIFELFCTIVYIHICRVFLMGHSRHLFLYCSSFYVNN